MGKGEGGGNKAGVKRLTPFFAQVGPRHPSIFFPGGLFNPRGGGGSLRQISILKIIIFWYIHIMLLDATLNDTN